MSERHGRSDASPEVQQTAPGHADRKLVASFLAGAGFGASVVASLPFMAHATLVLVGLAASGWLVWDVLRRARHTKVAR